LYSYVEKNGFAERSKILATIKKVILNYQNNYVVKPDARISKFFAALLISFKVPIKLFSDLYSAKF